MRTKIKLWIAIVGWSLSWGIGAEEPKADADTKSTKEADAPGPLAKLVPKSSTEGTEPADGTIQKGGWTIAGSPARIQMKPLPLCEGWFAFGTEIREKGATIRSRGQAPDKPRIQSRIGVGLYGKNGFQLRLVPARQEVELVRRGAVLAKKALPLDAALTYEMELSVAAEGTAWVITGRVWEEGGERPVDELIRHKIWNDELLFPLAGQAALVATPFSGKPVSFSGAEVYLGGPPEEQEKTPLEVKENKP
jgi:hypothetical protein